VESGLGALASPEAVALLAAFLGLPPPTPLQMSPELQRRKTIDLLVQWTLALSAVQPLVVFVEGLHWCEASTLELLGHVIAQSPTARVLLLATARPEFTPPWPAHSNLTTMQLPRLTTRQARDMVTALGGPELAAATVDALVARADGVPLYVEELTKAVVEPRMARGVEAIPATLADSLMARLDRLSAAKEVAQRAAVLGREFGYPLLAATAGLDEAALRHGLARLIDAEILFARGAPPAATYIFKHALIQETAYESLLKRTRQQLHARVAQGLEERFPERVAAEPEVVARHAEAAGLAATAATYYQRAGEQAQEQSAHEEAITRFRKALALVETLPVGPERDAREERVQMALGGSLVAVRGYAHADTAKAYERARALCEAAGDEEALAAALVGLSLFYYVNGEPDRGIALAERVRAMGEETGNQSLVFRGHANLAPPKHYQGRFAVSLEHGERALALYDRVRNRAASFWYGEDQGVGVLGFMAWNLCFLGRPDRALARAREGVGLARSLAHPFSLAWALFWETIVHWLRRDVAAQRERAAEVIALSDAQGFPVFLGAGRAFAAHARATAGEGASALTAVSDGFALAASTGTRAGTPGLLVLLAETQRAVCQPPREALDIVETALAIGAQTGQRFFDAELRRLKGELLHSTEPQRAPEAEALFRRALDVARAQEAKSFELHAATSFARLWQHQGNRAEARALLAPVYAWFTEGFDTGDLVEAKALLDELT
jgi:predicted ATPase